MLSICQASKESIVISPEKAIKKCKHPSLGDYNNNWMKGTLHFKQINYLGKS